MEGTVTLTMKRSDLVDILQGFNMDRIKRKDRTRLTQRLLAASDAQISEQEYAVKREQKKKSSSTTTTPPPPPPPTSVSKLPENATPLPPRALPSPQSCVHLIIVGCGEISRLYVNCLAGRDGIVIAAVCDLNKQAAAALCKEINALQHQAYPRGGIPSCIAVDCLETMNTEWISKVGKHVIAINLTPCEHHYPINQYLLQQQVHVWSEKPMTSTFNEALALVTLARARGVLLGCSPITFFGAAQQCVGQLLKQNLIGTPLLVDCRVMCGGWMDYSFRTSGWAQHRRFGIGSLRDVGIYPLSLLTFFFGRASSITASKLEVLLSNKNTTEVTAKTTQSTETAATSTTAGPLKMLDGWMMRVAFENGVLANISSSLSLSANAAGGQTPYGMTIRGDRGAITLDSMWNNDTKITFVPEKNGGDVDDSDRGKGDRPGQPQVWSTSRAPFLAQHSVSHPHVCDWGAGVVAMSRNLLDSATSYATGTSSVFDGTHAAHIVELLELAEKSASNNGELQTIKCQPLDVCTYRPPPLLPQCSINSNNIVFGTMSLNSSVNPMSLLDAVWGMGCHILDVAHVYGQAVESLVGKWWTSRRIDRTELTLVGKGGHPFRNSAHKARLGRADINKDLDESLERLQTTYVDVFLLHRDDPTLFPSVLELCETMHALVTCGKIRAWGTSNFSPQRIEALHECAEAQSWVAPSYASPQYSLAIPATPVWDGTTTLTPEHRMIFAKHGTKVLGWATLAEGMLCGKVSERSRSAARWMSAENCQRKLRLERLATAKGLTVAALAIAYALNSGCDSAVVGCRTVQHFHDAARASTVVLSEEEVQYLR